ncbi:hypothetical protein [Zooshikella ganghwensis]|uniref:Uncharacterized protein n=2 Tax=Zooshikella ganghwensis TaxID=202772 RepID=A0A4P9VNE6_9GAMM|nr:hypothetical protein [Zooshikella ganghwensis]RDH43924.1 hypothetical protein B9G39_10975 [Zooshikella ganghwensis]
MILFSSSIFASSTDLSLSCYQSNNTNEVIECLAKAMVKATVTGDFTEAAAYIDPDTLSALQQQWPSSREQQGVCRQLSVKPCQWPTSGEALLVWLAKRTLEKKPWQYHTLKVISTWHNDHQAQVSIKWLPATNVKSASNVVNVELTYKKQQWYLLLPSAMVHTLISLE